MVGSEESRRAGRYQTCWLSPTVDCPLLIWLAVSKGPYTLGLGSWDPWGMGKEEGERSRNTGWHIRGVGLSDFLSGCRRDIDQNKQAAIHKDGSRFEKRRQGLIVSWGRRW